MQTERVLLKRLTEVDARYAYCHDWDEEAGSLVVESDDGDTILPPYTGLWTFLEEVESREDALSAAKVWEENS